MCCNNRAGRAVTQTRSYLTIYRFLFLTWQNWQIISGLFAHFFVFFSSLYVTGKHSDSADCCLSWKRKNVTYFTSIKLICSDCKSAARRRLICGDGNLIIHLCGLRPRRRSRRSDERVCHFSIRVSAFRSQNWTLNPPAVHQEVPPSSYVRDPALLNLPLIALTSTVRGR